MALCGSVQCGCAITAGSGILVTGAGSAASPLTIAANVTWTNWTPQVDQGGTTNITKTVNRARYWQVGKLVGFDLFLTLTASGTSSQFVLVSLPVTAASSGHTVAGGGYISDSSASLNYHGFPFIQSTTRMGWTPTTAGSGLGLLGIVSFSAALASGDVLTLSAIYEAA